MANLRLITLIILAVAAALRSEIFFYLLYVLVALQLAAWAWVVQSSRSLRWSRQLPATAFPGEPVEVKIVVRNEGLRPIPWLALHESLPPSLRTPPSVRQVLALGARRSIRSLPCFASQMRSPPPSTRAGPLSPLRAL